MRLFNIVLVLANLFLKSFFLVSLTFMSLPINYFINLLVSVPHTRTLHLHTESVHYIHLCTHALHFAFLCHSLFLHKFERINYVWVLALTACCLRTEWRLFSHVDGVFLPLLVLMKVYRFLTYQGIATIFLRTLYWNLWMIPTLFGLMRPQGCIQTGLANYVCTRLFINV